MTTQPTDPALDRTVSYRIVRLDFWEYRHPTGYVFHAKEDALACAARLQRESPDPLSCYIIEPE